MGLKPRPFLAPKVFRTQHFASEFARCKCITHFHCGVPSTTVSFVRIKNGSEQWYSIICAACDLAWSERLDSFGTGPRLLTDKQFRLLVDPPTEPGEEDPDDDEEEGEDPDDTDRWAVSLM